MNASNEEKKLKAINNDFLHLVFKSITDAKAMKFSEDDRSKFNQCEDYRKRLLASNQTITYEVFNSDKTALVKDVCRKAASSQSWCRLVYNIVKQTSAKNIFEIGTNLGISGSYILQALRSNRNAYFNTLEGVPALCAISQKQFSNLDPNENFKIWEGLYENTFDKAYGSIDTVDLAFIDGNHQYAPTIEYYQKLKSKAAGKSLFIFDDINWSDGMKKAWKEIKSDQAINFSIDLFEIGIVVFDETFEGKRSHFEFHYDY